MLKATAYRPDSAQGLLDGPFDDLVDLLTTDESRILPLAEDARGASFRNDQGGLDYRRIRSLLEEPCADPANLSSSTDIPVREPALTH